ncbi:MAG: twin-arginine translocase TatA/TatE family subunit [Pontimonas sp.]|nr:twin-arginine translocase TatA/TatE family subunit [Pontimonas sp.]
MSFGLTIEKLLLIGIIALFLIGPDRLPAYSAQLGRLIRQLRDMASGAKERMRDELGPDFDDMDWKKLDPRQYDPRRIIREALKEDPAAKSEADPEPVVIESAYQRRKRLSGAGKPAPFDPDLT